MLLSFCMEAQTQISDINLLCSLDSKEVKVEDSNDEVFNIIVKGRYKSSPGPGDDTTVICRGRRKVCLIISEPVNERQGITVFDGNDKPIDEFEVVSKSVRVSKSQDKGEDCLLYTSPSPRDQRGSRMPSSA